MPNHEFNLNFKENISILHDSTFGANVKPQEVSFNDSLLTPLEEHVESIGSKHIIAQETLMASPLVSTQIMHIQGNIYESLEIGKSLPILLSFRYMTYVIESTFNDPP